MPGSYPRAEPGRLLINRQGRFLASESKVFEDIGLATDARWADANGDGHPDLLVTTEWGPVRLFLNRDGQFVERTQSAGLSAWTGDWRCIEAMDVDQDGDMDFLVGNLGRNTKYRVSHEFPRVIYHGHFSGAAQPVLLEGYYENGTLYPVRGFDELSRILPVLRGRFRNFHEFSSATLEEIFTPEALAQAAQWRMNTTDSGVLVNDGMGRFKFEPWPARAQLAPVNDIAVGPLDPAGQPIVVLAQNDFSPQGLAGRFDGGLSLILVVNNQGQFKAISPSESGIVVPGEARKIALVDIDDDGSIDLIIGTPGERMRAYSRHPH